MNVRANARCGEIARCGEVARTFERARPLAWDGFRPLSSGAFQVVNTTQSRGRTGRTLFTRSSLLSAGAGMLRTDVILRF
jgi:hypothetical protein